MIWLIGNKGMLGTELSEMFESIGLPFVGTGRGVSILDEAALAAFAADKNIRWIVNCAAYTLVDTAEDDIKLCTALNCDGPLNIARTAQRIGASLLHISTDYVFDGNGTRPYTEDDPIRPTSVYGRTKAEGERAAMDVCRRTVIIRTAWLYGKHGPNFVDTMLRFMNERDSIGVVADQRGTPTWARDLAASIVTILRAEKHYDGIYHFTNAGESTWFDFAMEIKKLGLAYGLLEHDCIVNPLTTAEYPTKAKRPAYSVLSKEKIKEVYGVTVPDWKESLDIYIKGEINAQVRHRVGDRWSRFHRQ